MGLNDLLSRHQISVMRAEAAACLSSRHAHTSLANSYAAEINRRGKLASAGAAPLRRTALPVVA